MYSIECRLWWNKGLSDCSLSERTDEPSDVVLLLVNRIVLMEVMRIRHRAVSFLLITNLLFSMIIDNHLQVILGSVRRINSHVNRANCAFRNRICVIRSRTVMIEVMRCRAVVLLRIMSVRNYSIVVGSLTNVYRKTSNVTSNKNAMRCSCITTMMRSKIRNVSVDRWRRECWAFGFGLFRCFGFIDDRTAVFNQQYMCRREPILSGLFQ